jgi:hypothetical protein
VQGGIIRSLQEMTLAELVRFAGGPAVEAPRPLAAAEPTPRQTD